MAVLAAVVALAGCEQSLRLGPSQPGDPHKLGILEAHGTLVGGTPFTVEVWIKPSAGAAAQQPCSNTGASIVQSATTEYPGLYFKSNRWGLGLSPDGDLFFGASSKRLVATAIAYEIPEPVCTTLPGAGARDGKWHHVAVTRTTAGAVKIFFDGTLAVSGTSGAGSLALTPPTSGGTKLTVGGAADLSSANPIFDGQIDELRLSTTARYTSPFTRPSAPFTSDAATAALWHLDEMKGAKGDPTFADSSGRTQAHPLTPPYTYGPQSEQPLSSDSPFTN